MGVRRNQATLTAGDWQAFIAAINAMHGIGVPAPAYRDFVRVHVDAMSRLGMPWGVHTMPRMGMVGRNFLAWHRQFLVQLERRLQRVDHSVSIPYWNWSVDRALPAQINTPALLRSWGVTRAWNASTLPPTGAATAVEQETQFAAFQPALEAIHNLVHIAVGGTMNSPSSPADPLFWLHHANIDRIWAEWQSAHPGANPPNTNETLQPAPLFGVKVATVLDITALSYQYA
jgi:tyrosinase